MRRVVLSAIAGGFLLAVPGVAIASPVPTDAGAVLVYEPDRPSEPLLRGDSSTPFGLRLPEDAACPGDSRNDGWRVQAFIVPTSVPMEDVEWTVIGATGPNHSLLFTVNQDLFVDELTVANSTVGQPGRIADPPVFSFAAMRPGTLSSGSYRIGIACTKQRQLDRYWSTELIVELDDQDELTWRLDDVPAADPEGGIEISSVWVLRGLAVAGLVGALVYLLRQRRRTDEPSTPPAPQETRS